MLNACCYLYSSEILLRQILDVLKQSTIAKKPPPSDDLDGFWDVYDQEAEEFDKALFEKYASDLDNGLIFVSFPDPSRCALRPLSMHFFQGRSFFGGQYHFRLHNAS